MSGREKEGLVEERAEAAEKQKELEEQAARELEEIKNAPVKTLSEVLQPLSEVKHVYVAELGCKLAFKRLDLEAFMEVQEKKEPMAMAGEMLFLMLHAADESVTREQIGKIPFELATDILGRMTGQSPFLKKAAGK